MLELLKDIGGVALRVAGLYVFTLVAFRIMGKRALGQMQPFDLVIVITFAEILGEPLADPDLKMVAPLTALTMLVIFQVVVAWVSMRSRTVRKAIEGEPILMVKDGKVLTKNLAAARWAFSDLVEHIRARGIDNVSDIEAAYLEANGTLSVIKKKSAHPITPRYLGTPPSRVVIKDSKLNRAEMRKARVSQVELMKMLGQKGINDVADVEMALLDPTGGLVIQKKRKDLRPRVRGGTGRKRGGAGDLKIQFSKQKPPGGSGGSERPRQGAEAKQPAQPGGGGKPGPKKED